MMIKATDIRRGMVITIEGTNYVVVDFAHHTPGNLRAKVQTKLRNMSNGALIEKRLRSVDEVEVPYVQTKEFEYLDDGVLRGSWLFTAGMTLASNKKFDPVHVAGNHAVVSGSLPRQIGTRAYPSC